MQLLAILQLFATTEVSLKIGETKQDEVTHHGVFASALVGGRYEALPWLDVALDLAATKATADWEDVSGLSTAAVSAAVHGARGALRWRVGAGVTLPLATVGTVHTFPDRTGDSFVFGVPDRFASEWDHSAYRRAAMNRGNWNLWMWAPDWVTTFVPARVAYDASSELTVAFDAALAAAFAIGDGHDDEAAVVVQAAADVAWHANARSRFGLRVLDVLVVNGERSPHVTSIEPSYGLRSGPIDLHVRLTIPVRDHELADVDPRFSAYEQWAVNTQLAFAF